MRFRQVNTRRPDAPLLDCPGRKCFGRLSNLECGSAGPRWISVNGTIPSDRATDTTQVVGGVETLGLASMQLARLIGGNFEAEWKLASQMARRWCRADQG